MKHSQLDNIKRYAALASLGFLAACSVALSGCKESTSAAIPERTIKAPPEETVGAAQGDVRAADPLTGDLWLHAKWMDLGAPANTWRTTPPTRAAMLYDADMLYVAFVSDQPMEGPADGMRDNVTLYLDATAEGKGAEVAKVSIDSMGQASSSWVRTAQPPVRARQDGSPDLDVQVFTIPNWQIHGLWTRVENGTRVDKTTGEKVPVWAAVLGVPVKNLPMVPQTPIGEGTHWKFNLMRTMLPGTGGEWLQSNLSAVYVGEQEFAPYRMAKLVVGQ